MPKLSIIIPAYNEAPTIRELVEKILGVNFPVDYEIIIVDDRSGDRTFEIISALSREEGKEHIRVLRNPVNRGKGHSIQKGLEEATGEFAVVQDADFEYDPSEIPMLLEPLLRGEAQVIYGSRFLARKRPEGMALANYVANKLLTWMTNVLYGAHLTDMETCYKLIRMDVIKSIPLHANRFDFEPEITTKLIKKGFRIKELPIRYRGRSASEGKKIKARDFFIAVKVLLANRFTSC